MTAVQTLNEIHAYGLKVADDSTKRITPEIGKYAAQGDVNFVFLPKIPSNAIPAKPVTQLAPGNTRGSRHCIKSEHVNHVQFFRLPNPNPLQGLILVFDAETEIEHPEHGNHIYPAGTIVAVTFQRKYADELRRIED